jgi:cadmium resistance protein CadD (predicted permease)
MLGFLGRAVVLFAITNIDDLVLLALHFGTARGDRAHRRIVIGQYLGFGAILAVSVLAAYGLRLLPDNAVAYLGLIPIALGVRAAFIAWRHRGASNRERRPVAVQASSSEVAGVTFANGADNLSIYIPVFAASETSAIVAYAIVFLLMVGVWCAAGHYFATRQVVTRALARWGHILQPIVLITIGALILIEGDAFGL